MLKNMINIKEEVKEALANHKPVIALESTIIAHGMPHPKNVQTAIELEQIARTNGVVPATIAIIDGVINVGLSEDQIDQLGKSNVMKVSTRDISFAIAKRRMGATTVSATMFIANMVGIKIFATGGIGGVHREAENTFDISADLVEFSNNPVMVVTAGAKAILDLPKTLEVLETYRVPIIGYGTYEFPAFYSSDSGLKISTRIENPNEAASILRTHLELKMNTGIILANPIPRKDEIPADTMNNFIRLAITDMKFNRISGKEVTPYLLSRLVSLTEGKSLKANISLVKNNVAVASEIAKVFYKE